MYIEVLDLLQQVLQISIGQPIRHKTLRTDTVTNSKKINFVIELTSNDDL
jgi:hypothetical protein